ncbi:protein kinase [Angomonas deanei]|uniref:Protein kinase domain/Protein tyrosine kinase/Kinase-like, putative n=1 Tax=Angomonas deanei TaxID=59799 RepID=S9U1F4_9TRYP|nr:protein kinase [Angomonas deanei]EPY40180.1 protein kinase [Angomonas deanei]CAD2221553.1 Protein kinase domain/Protein tyrosine kinase/Kinase-like, putative [Angomonas deanei]|eukprot:EPY24567.1 protein kinase [Angomonas deanei]
MKVLEVFDEPARVVLILEMMEGGTLFQDIVSNGALSEDRAGRLLFDVLTGLQVLHSNGIMHRDIKPENLFFRTGRKDVLAVGDFGFATNKIPATGYLGSPQYSAPELALIGVQGQHHSHTGAASKALYNEKCDIWSVGVIAFVMLTGLLPFDGQSAEEVFQSVIRNNVPWNKPECRAISPKAKAFIQSLLESNPSKRPAAQAALRNPWLAAYKH